MDENPNFHYAKMFFCGRILLLFSKQKAIETLTSP
jgi:hypothetical protein